MSFIPVDPPLKIRIIVRNYNGPPIFGYIVGSSGEGETYDDVIFSAPSWVVKPDYPLSYYDSVVQHAFVDFPEKGNKNKVSDKIIIRKDSKLDPDFIQIVYQEDPAFYADGVDRKKGGVKKRRRTRRRNRRERRKSSSKRRKR